MALHNKDLKWKQRTQKITNIGDSYLLSKLHWNYQDANYTFSSFQFLEQMDIVFLLFKMFSQNSTIQS